MLYYQVPAALDQKPLYKPGNGPRRRNGWILIGGELLTPAEARRRNAPVSMLTPVHIKKTCVYTFFGARFIMKDTCTPGEAVNA